ncbi:MAG TPA: exodeoxyribonuclease III [Candidatus Marinimicrobia bacterium]|nr:exodeoxyribonuclease III [Candidatus Neomarinimicrobiota bacterium]
MLLTLISWNVNGIRAVYKKGFLDWVKATQPDILGIQETKAEESQLPPDLAQISGYRSYFSSAIRKGYSGVALYSRLKPVSITQKFGIEKFDTEGRLLIADYDQFVLFNVYFPNGQMSEERLRFKLEFYDAFLDYVDRVNVSGRNIIIGGDVNTAHTEIDLAHPVANSNISGFLPEERAWLDKFLSHGYYDTFRLFNNEPGNYTWWSPFANARERNIGWRLDYFFVNKRFVANVRAAEILADVAGSDHCPVSLQIEI